MYLVQNLNVNTNIGGANRGVLGVYAIAGALGAETLTLLTNCPASQPWANVAPAFNFAPQSNLSTKIWCGDSRVQNVVYRNGSLWCAQTVFLPADNPTRSAVQWWQFTPDGPVEQWGRIEDANGINFYAFPSIAVNRFGDALIGHARFSTNEFPSACYSFRDFRDQAGTFRKKYRLKEGEGRYWREDTTGGRNRWGDYTATVIDPANDSDFWTIQEYALPPVGSGLDSPDGRWATWWGSVTVTVPTNDNFAAATQISGSQGTIAGTNLRATRETGEPDHAGNTTAHSVWYYWTAPGGGSVTIHTIGSSINTVLAIYTGSSVANLALVASDDDSGGNGASCIVFTATSNTTYRVVVDGYITNGFD